MIFRSRRPSWRLGLVAAAVAATFAVSGLLTSVTATPAPVALPSAAAPAQGGFADLIQAVKPAVVNISVKAAVTQARLNGPGPRPFGPGSPFEDFFRRFGQPLPHGGQPHGQQMVQGSGSGFVIAAEGYVVTNSHVVDGAEEVTVTFDDGTVHSAEVRGVDSKTDLAVLKIETDDSLPYVEFGDSDAARVGDWVIAIGNPFGLGGTATTGIVSARGRDIQAGPFDDFLQIDAPINRGNSGGPLFDTSGRVIGINTAIYSPSGGNVGIGFAIPSATAEAVIAALKIHGHVERGWLGVRIQAVTNEIGHDAAKRLGPFAEKHDMYAVFHNHGQPRDTAFKFEDFLAYSPNNMLNLDVGHYFGATGKNPTELMRKLHDRIYSIHLKDKTGPDGYPPDSNAPWGHGETPLGDILKLIQVNEWNIYCDIELEYEIPEESNAVIETGKCVNYARNLLNSPEI